MKVKDGGGIWLSDGSGFVECRGEGPGWRGLVGSEVSDWKGVES